MRERAREREGERENAERDMRCFWREEGSGEEDDELGEEENTGRERASV